jgi:hypothetical protein
VGGVTIRCGFLIFLALAFEAPAGPDSDSIAARFVEKQVIHFSAAQGMGTGVSAADYDDDGDVDLFLPSAAGHPNLLLRNNGDGTFLEAQQDAGVDSWESTRAALWVDFDGDGQLDLLTAGDYWGVPPEETAEGDVLRLYRQSDGRFVEVTDETGIDSTWIAESRAHLGGLCAGDIDNDGFIDILVSIWGGVGNHLYVNNRNGTFSEIAQLSNLQSPANYWQPIMCDFNRDGWTDIYSAIDFAPNALWINQRNLKFRDRGFATGSDNHMNDMGAALGDYDNDGDFDVFVTNIERQATHSVLFRNDMENTELKFTETAQASGLDRGGWAWGCTFFDADNDGWLDLALTNGWPDRNEYLPDQSRLYRNREGIFTDVSDAAGFADSFWGSSLVAADIDGDGDADLIQTCIDDDSKTSHLRILENRLDSVRRSQVLTVLPRMSGANKFAVGTKIQVQLSSGLTLTRQISTGCSFLGQEPLEARFGVGDAGIDAVSILWPDGTWTELGPQASGATIAPVNQYPDRFIDINRDRDGRTVRITWHGGTLEEAKAGLDRIEWSPVPQPSNPFRVTPGSPEKIFRVGSD